MEPGWRCRKWLKQRAKIEILYTTSAYHIWSCSTGSSTFGIQISVIRRSLTTVFKTATHLAPEWTRSDLQIMWAMFFFSYRWFLTCQYTNTSNNTFFRQGIGQLALLKSSCMWRVKNIKRLPIKIKHCQNFKLNYWRWLYLWIQLLTIGISISNLILFVSNTM